MKTICLVLILCAGAAFADGPDVRSPDFYKRLGIQRNADEREIKSAFRKLAMQFHPDRNGGAGEDILKLLNEANDTLKDPAKRAAYDRGQSGVYKSYASQPEAPRSSARREALDRGNKIIYDSHMQRLKGLDVELAKTISKTDLKFNAVAFFYRMIAFESRWKKNGTDATDSLGTLNNGDPNDLGYQAAIADYFSELMMMNYGFSSALIAQELLTKTRVEVLQQMLEQNYPMGDEYIVADDIIKSMYSVPSSNTEQIMALARTLDRSSKYDSVGLKLLAEPIYDLAKAYLNLDKSLARAAAARQSVKAEPAPAAAAGPGDLKRNSFIDLVKMACEELLSRRNGSSRK